MRFGSHSAIRILPLIVVAVVPFLWISLQRSEVASAQRTRPANFDIRLDETDQSRRALSRLLARSGSDPDRVAAFLGRLEKAGDEVRRRIPDLRTESDPVSGTFGVISAERRGLPEMLTAPSAMTRPDILRRFLGQHRSLFGLSEGEIAALTVTADYANPDGGLSFVRMVQEIDGIPVFQGELTAAFSRRNEIVRIVNGFVPTAENVIGPEFGDYRSALESVATHLPGFEPAAPEKFYFPIAPGILVPAWRVYAESRSEVEYVLIDAVDGTVLWRKLLTDHQTQSATFAFYGNATSPLRTADSPSPFTPGCNSPTGCLQPPAIGRTQFTLIGNEPPYTFNDLGWVADGENRSIGNNAEAGIDRDSTQGIDPNGWAFGSPNRTFVYAYNPPPGIPAPGDDPFPVPQIYPPSPYQQGSVTHAFYVANRWHDETYLLGFNEAARNFQTDNFGRGGNGGDSLIVEVQEGIGTNGANFSTPADGGRGRLQMFIWAGPTPDRDGALDSQVMVHELTHGLTNRLHGNATGLTSNMARGMGEGWSDFYALALLSEPSDDVCGNHAVGGYVTYQITAGFEANYYYGIRRFPTNRKHCVGPNGRPHNPLTFRYLNSDCNTLIGTTTSDPPPSSAFPRGPIGVTICDQVHNVGEVWSAALWEVRGFLIEAHGGGEGNRRALQYITDGMKLSPVNPNMLQARDAIIAAAAARDSADVIRVRRGFAARGLGVSASIVNAGTGSNNTVVIEAFDIQPNARIAGGFAVSDSIGNNNGALEPGERVVVTLPLINDSGESLTGVNVVSTILGGSAFYGDIAAGQTVSRNFVGTIPNDVSCGTQLVIGFGITSSSGATNETRSVLVGALVQSLSFTNSTQLTINESGASAPYGTAIEVSGLNSANTRIALELTGVTHTFPSDLDILLVGPGGQKFIPVSDTGGGANVNSLTITLSDLDANPLSATQWTAGGFRPTDVGGGDTFPAPAPAPPYLSPAPAGSSGFGSAFGSNGPSLNGTWTLFVVDDAAPDGGSMAGWKLRFDSYVCSACASCATGPRVDFDGDGRADRGVFRPSDGIWYLDRSTNGFAASKWGIDGDRITPGRFDSDQLTDFAVFRPSADPSAPDFYVLNSSDLSYRGVSWGLPGDVPVVADYDGDGRDDIAVFRPSDHTFYVLRSGPAGLLVFSNISFGTPVTGDFDGDGRADFATYSFDGWFLAPSNINYGAVSFIRFGAQNDKPVPGDYDGDGRDDLAVFRPSDQTWYIRRSSGGTTFFRFGIASDVPIPDDYDGDGRLDIAVFRNGVWYVERSAGGTEIGQFGLAGDIALQSGFLP